MAQMSYLFDEKDLTFPLEFRPIICVLVILRGHLWVIMIFVFHSLLLIFNFLHLSDVTYIFIKVDDTIITYFFICLL